MPVLERGCRSEGKDEIFQISFNRKHFDIDVCIEVHASIHTSLDA
jgi:hypothetical protein